MSQGHYFSGIQKVRQRLNEGIKIIEFIKTWDKDKCDKGEY